MARRSRAINTSNVIPSNGYLKDFMIFALVLFIGIVIFIIWLVTQNGKYTNSVNNKQHVIYVTKENDLYTSHAKNIVSHPEIKIAPPQENYDQPPVYPKQNPAYPLRNQEQSFQQLGVLVSQDSNEDQPTLLGLFGKRMNNRDRWEYYVASDKYHMWRLPAQYKNRRCDDDVGCEEIYDGDEVVVPDYANKTFRARIYKYAKP